MEKALNDRFNHIKNNPTLFQNQHKWIADDTDKRIKYISYVGATGYADAAREYIRSINENGTKVVLQSAKTFDDKNDLILSDQDNVLAIAINNKNINYDVVIIHTIPTLWKEFIDVEKKINGNVKIYGLTVWETDLVDQKWIECIHDAQIDGLILPTQWNKDIFIQSGEKYNITLPKIHVVPHAICDSSITDKRVTQTQMQTRQTLYGKDANNKLTVLCIGTWTPRKGIEETVHAYIKAFENRKDVVLYLKTGIGKYNQKNTKLIQNNLIQITSQYKNIPKIILDTNVRSSKYIEELTQCSDVYLSLCNSEGVGLGACYSALQDKIIVMTGYGGQREYIQKAEWVDYTLDVVKVPEKFAEWIKPPQKWAYPNITHATQILKQIRDNKEHFIQKNKGNRNYILENLSYIKCGKLIIDIIESEKTKDL
jgi:glycosyltransferase involved in cell wall biosynthesis